LAGNLDEPSVYLSINFISFVEEQLKIAYIPGHHSKIKNFYSKLSIKNSQYHDSIQIFARDLEEEAVRRASFPPPCPRMGVPVSFYSRPIVAT
jgi:hypothetical protein